MDQTLYPLDKKNPWKRNFQTFEWLGKSSPNYSYHIWNHKSVFLWTFHHSSVSWEITLLWCFSWNFVWSGQKQPIKVKFQTFDCSREISPDLYFDRFLLLKVCKTSAKKSIEELCLITLRNEEFEEKVVCCFKNDKDLVNFNLRPRNSQNFHFYWLLLCKVYNVWHKKVQWSYLSWVKQNLKKNWLVFWKMTWEIWQMFTRALESFKIGILIGSFHSK